MKILFAGFEGKNNSSKLLVDKLNTFDKIYLKNDKDISCKQLNEKLQNNDFDIIFLFGQKPLLKNKISLELIAKQDEREISTRFNYKEFGERLISEDITFRYSKNAGTSYCNNVYFFVLNSLQGKNTKAVFIHLPFKKYFNNINKIIDFFNTYE